MVLFKIPISISSLLFHRNAVCVCELTLYPVIYQTNLLVLKDNCVLFEQIGLLMPFHSIFFSFPSSFLFSLLFFSCLVALARTSIIMVSRIGRGDECSHHCLFLMLGGKHSVNCLEIR